MDGWDLVASFVSPVAWRRGGLHQSSDMQFVFEMFLSDHSMQDKWKIYYIGTTTDWKATASEE